MTVGQAAAAEPPPRSKPATPSPSRRPAGFTPDPLDCAFCWHLLSLLTAVGALPEAAAELPQGEREQLLRAGQGCVGMPARPVPTALWMCSSQPRILRPRLSPSLPCPLVPFLSAAAATRMSFVSQLECVGGLARWAVYAALHIPDAEERCKVGLGPRAWPGRGRAAGVSR